MHTTNNKLAGGKRNPGSVTRFEKPARFFLLPLPASFSCLLFRLNETNSPRKFNNFAPELPSRSDGSYNCPKISDRFSFGFDMLIPKWKISASRSKIAKENASMLNIVTLSRRAFHGISFSLKEVEQSEALPSLSSHNLVHPFEILYL